MTRATKFSGKQEMPDCENRAKALRYIDSLGRIQDEMMDNTVVLRNILNKRDYED